MAALGIRYGRGGGAHSVYGRGTNLRAPMSNPKPLSMAMIRGGRKSIMSISMSMTVAQTAHLEKNWRKQKQEESISYENVIDEWMKDSVVEIVKNLRDAPLMVQVYSGDGNKTRLKTEKAVPEEWLMVKSKWENGTTPMPEGVIFVEQLKQGEEWGEVESEFDDRMMVGSGRESEITRAWGILVQAKGRSCGPACYLLKTSRGGSSSGLGLCCTHFCLVKVKSFRETAEAHFKNCWLLNGH